MKQCKHCERYLPHCDYYRTDRLSKNGKNYIHHHLTCSYCQRAFRNLKHNTGVKEWSYYSKNELMEQIEYDLKKRGAIVSRKTKSRLKKKWRKTHFKCCICKEWRKGKSNGGRCKKCNSEYQRKYQKKHYRENMKDPSYRKLKYKYLTNYQRKRRETDNLFRLTHNIRSYLNQQLSTNGWSKKSKTQKLLGCSFEELKKHMETQFVKGMSWDNWGDWHIDHIIPLSSANTREEMESLWHHSNLQPLWAKDNLEKRDKIPLICKI